MKRTTDTNTLALIRRWSMAGAVGDLGGRFGSPVDILAIVSKRGEAQDGETREPAAPHVMLKPAGEDGWQPLLVEAPSPA